MGELGIHFTRTYQYNILLFSAQEVRFKDGIVKVKEAIETVNQSVADTRQVSW